MSSRTALSTVHDNHGYKEKSCLEKPKIKKEILYVQEMAVTSYLKCDQKRKVKYMTDTHKLEKNPTHQKKKDKDNCTYPHKQKALNTDK